MSVPSRFYTRATWPPHVTARASCTFGAPSTGSSRRALAQPAAPGRPPPLPPAPRLQARSRPHGAANPATMRRSAACTAPAARLGGTGRRTLLRPAWPAACSCWTPSLATWCRSTSPGRPAAMQRAGCGACAAARRSSGWRRGCPRGRRAWWTCARTRAWWRGGNRTPLQ